HAEETGLDEILPALGPGRSLVGFAGAPADNGSRRLVAFVANGGSQALKCLDLGSADSLETLIDRWKASLGSPGPTRSEAECRRLGASVARAVWTPVAAATAGSKNLIVVPEAPVSGLPWGALPVGKSQYLVEAGPVIHVLDSEREIVSPKE